MRKPLLALLLLTSWFSVPASAQLSYFGYVGAGDNDSGLAQTKNYTNFAHIASTVNLTDPYLRDRVAAMAQKGIKATIDLGYVLWCDYDGTNRYRYLCWDWMTRWTTWKNFNASILVPDKVLAFAVRDEPFNNDVDMNGYEQAVARVKADLPWAKLWMTEASCVILGYCGTSAGAFGRYGGTLPNIDWIGTHSYSIHPATDAAFLSARDILKSRFPGKKWLYVMDGFWGSGHAEAFYPNDISYMGFIAREWYDFARADPDAVILGVFLWGPLGAEPGSSAFPCSALLEHVAIGRAITGKARSLPVGRLERIDHGTGQLFGWACHTDGGACEKPPIDIRVDGGNHTTGFYTGITFVNPQCGTGVAYEFRQNLVDGTSGHRMTAFARHQTLGGTTLPSACPDNPACIWYHTSNEPKGYMDGISPSGVATGWVCDPDEPLVSSKVRLALGNGTQIGVYTTNQANEQAVADECGGGYTHRFSVQLPAWSRGLPIYAYAQDLVFGETQIPWLCYQGWYCVWY